VAPEVEWYFPAAQLRHIVDEVAPTVVEYLPTPQSVHTVAPAVAENLPAAQLRHTVDEVAPFVPEYLPAAQALQLTLNT